jgi:enoyl-CoA hydratase
MVGLGLASLMVFTGDTIDAKEAARMGIADKIVPHADLMKETKEVANKIANMAPLAVSLAKKALHQGLIEPNMASHMSYEIYANALLANTDDFKEGVASFLEKREPNFRGK